MAKIPIKGGKNTPPLPERWADDRRTGYAPIYALAISLVLTLILASPGYALTLGYSGRLADASGAPLEGPLDIDVRFFGSATGSDQLGSLPTYREIRLVDGIFQLELDLDSRLIQQIFGDGTRTVFIEVAAAGKTYPRQQFLAVPYALRVPIDGSTLVFGTDGALAVGRVTMNQVYGLNAELNGKAATSDLSTKAPLSHTHGMGEVTGLGGVLAGKADVNAALTGDVSGTLGGTSVDKIKGISIAAPVSGTDNSKYLQYDGTQFVLSAITPSSGGTVTSVTANSPLTVTGSPTVTPSITLPRAANGVDGYLAGSDFATFNGKQSPITSSSNLDIGTLTTSQQNGLLLKPYGSGAGATGELRFGPLTGGSYVGFKAPDSIVTPKIWTLPVADGTSNQVLSTNGSGALSWLSLPQAPITSVAGRTGVVTLTTADIAGTISVAQGGTGATTAQPFSVFAGPSIGPTAGAPGFRPLLAGDIPNLDVSKIATGTLPIGQGGTGLNSAPTNGQVLIGNGSSYTLSTLTAGPNIAINNAPGAITIAATSDTSKVSKAGDTMTGTLSLPNNGLIAGTNQLVLANGNVGIGTTNPQAALEVTGNVRLSSGGVQFPDGSLQASAAPAVGLVTLTDASSIAVDGALGAVYKVTLGGNRTLANPTNLVPGAVYTFLFSQDATGGRTLAFGSNYAFPASIPAPALSTAPGATDSAQFVSDGTSLYYVSGFASVRAMCLAPTNVTAISTISGTDVITNVTWTDPNVSVTNIIIQRSLDGGGNWTSLATVAAGTTSTSYSDSDLTTQSASWRVTANCGAAGTMPSVAVTGASSVVAPSSFTRTPINNTSTTLTWTNTANAESYEISRSIVGAGTWTVIATPSQDATSYTDSNLATNVTYSYRIRAVQETSYSVYLAPSTVCGTQAQFTCGTVGNDCYSNPNAVYGATASTPGGRCLTMVYANGISGFTVWKDQTSSYILSANGLDSWSMALNPSGKGQSTTPFVDANIGTSSTVLAGRACPTNVYISDSNKAATGKCLYYTPAYAAQTLNAAGNDNGAQLGMAAWSSAVWYVGNIATCSSKTMRLPTLFETMAHQPAVTNAPTADGSPIFSPSIGVPSGGSGSTWTSSAAITGAAIRYFTWAGTAGGWGDYTNTYAVRCVVP